MEKKKGTKEFRKWKWSDLIQMKKKKMNTVGNAKHNNKWMGCMDMGVGYFKWFSL